MDILLVSEGDSVHTYRWYCALKKKGHNVIVASFRKTTKYTYDQFYILGYEPLKKFGYLFSFFHLKVLIKKFKPDIVFAHYLSSYGFFSVLTGYYPTVVTAWGSDVLIAPKKTILHRMFLCFVVRRADCILSVAEHMSAQLALLGKSSKILTRPFGVDTSVFNMSRRKSFNQIPIIISTRNFTSVYSVETLVVAASFMYQNGAVFKLWLVGDGELRSKLEDMVLKFGLTDVVVFFGRVSQLRLADLLSQADIFVSTAISDGNNISLNEAMACGCYPIATDIPANSQWLRHGENGALFDCGDSFQLAAAIQKSFEIDLKKVALINSQIVKTDASWENCVDEVEKLFNSLILK